LWVLYINPDLEGFPTFAFFFLPFLNLFFFSFVLQYLFNWRLSFVIFIFIFIFLLSIEFFTMFENDLGYLGSSYLSFFVEFTLVNFLNWYLFSQLHLSTLDWLRIIFSISSFKVEVFWYWSSWISSICFLFITFHPSTLSCFGIEFHNIFGIPSIGLSHSHDSGSGVWFACSIC